MAIFTNVLLGLLVLSSEAEQKREAPERQRPVIVEPIAVLPMTFDGSFPQETRNRLESSFRAGLAQTKYETVPNKVDLEDSATCKEECFKQIHTESGAGSVVVARVRVREGIYDYEVQVFDAGTGALIVRYSSACVICTSTEIERRLGAEGSYLYTFHERVERNIQNSRDIARLRATLERQREEIIRRRDILSTMPLLTITSNPTGAMVLLDGEYVGTTPLTQRVSPGAHHITVHQGKKYIAAHRDVAVSPGMNLSVEAALAKSNDRIYRRLGGISLGASLPLLTISVVYGVMVSSNQDQDVPKEPAIATAIPGGALLAAGIGMLVHARMLKKSQFAFRYTGAGFLVEGRF